MTDATSDLEAVTDAVAAGPKSVTTDGLAVQSQDVSALIQLEKHRAEQAAARAPTLGVRFFNTRPPGAV